MTMADERVVSDIVTKFFLNTCRLHPQLTRHAVQAVASCALIAANRSDAETERIPLTTGSVAELFYIVPMLPLVGDVDVMHHRSTQLAIPRGHPPPTQLPTEFHNYVKIWEIVDSHFPGYVYLELRYLLTKRIEDDKYYCTECDNNQWLKNNFYSGAETTTHGPAVVTDYSHSPLHLSVDTVFCVRCLSWPLQATDWPKRHRNYDWPDSATVDRVVNNGCDVVRVAHRQCRQREWMGKHQWRLSFSRAEIVLINSWTPVQQIVYHMLRFFLKTKRLIDSADDSKGVMVSNYHIKTLMLWTSELKPRSWWTESLNLVRICVELLHTLSICLTDTHCPHYFVNTCNLFDNAVSVGMVASELISIDEAHLATWFVYKYVDKCARLCPSYNLRLFGDVHTITKLQNAVSEIIKFRLTSIRDDSFGAVIYASHLFLSVLSQNELTVWSCICWMKELTKSNLSIHLLEYFSGVAHLLVAHKMARNGFNYNLMDILATILGQFSDIPRYCKHHYSVVCLDTAVKMMKVVANGMISTVQLVENELSKAYLHRALRYRNSDRDSIYCLANVYLAVLNYSTGQYQTAIDHCTLVTRSQDHSQCSSHVVQGELLPKVDDNVDNVLGLTVFYQFVLSATLNQQRHRQYVSVTTEMFAYYLHCRLLLVTECRQVTQRSLPDVSQRCAKYISDMDQLFIGDVLFFKLLNGAMEQRIGDKPELSKCCRSATVEAKLNTTELVELLQRSAVEHLTTFRQQEARDFGSVATIVTTDFEALYAYKLGDYQWCLQLSTQNVHELLYAARLEEVLAFPMFIQLLDDDIVSLTALTLIVSPECRKWTSNIRISQVTLSLYLMTQCQLKLCHSVTSLSQTLDYIKVAQRKHAVHYTLNHLTLKLAERKATTYLRMTLSN